VINFEKFSDFYREKSKTKVDNIWIRNQFDLIGFPKPSVELFSVKSQFWNKPETILPTESLRSSIIIDAKQAPPPGEVSSVIMKLQMKSSNPDFILKRDFMNELKAGYPDWTQWDEKNIDILLDAEGTIKNDQVPTLSIIEFIQRFSPFSYIVESVRDFVRAGARDWFIGKYKNEEVANFFSIVPEDEWSYYCIRSVPVNSTYIKDHNYVFAISYRYKGQGLNHGRILKNKNHKICLLIKQGNIREFTNLKDLIAAVIPEPMKCLRLGSTFKDLVSIPKNLQMGTQDPWTPHYAPLAPHINVNN